MGQKMAIVHCPKTTSLRSVTSLFYISCGNALITANLWARPHYLRVCFCRVCELQVLILSHRADLQFSSIYTIFRSEFDVFWADLQFMSRR